MSNIRFNRIILHSPDRPQDIASCFDSQEGVVCRGGVKIRALFVSEESIRHPDLVGDLCADNHGVQIFCASKRQPLVPPGLAKVEIRCKILQHDSADEAKEDDDEKKVNVVA